MRKFEQGEEVVYFGQTHLVVADLGDKVVLAGATPSVVSEVKAVPRNLILESEGN